MSQLIYFVVQPIERSKKGMMVHGTPIKAGNSDQAVRLAKRIGQLKPGAFAYSRTVDLTSGDHNDPHVLARCGEVPEFLVESVV